VKDVDYGLHYRIEELPGGAKDQILTTRPYANLLLCKPPEEARRLP
jgi:hypothetical protein